MDQLVSEILKGESKTLEFKEELPKGKQLAKTLIAFANTSGGKLLIGVRDDGSIVGIDEASLFDLQDAIASILHDVCYPVLVPEIYSINVEQKLLLVIEVFRGNLLPYYFKSQGKDKGTYVRIGATNRLADALLIQELERQRFHSSYDEEVVHDILVDFLDTSPVYQRFNDIGKALTEQQLLSLRLLRPHQDTLHPTRGLLILLGYWDHVSIQCARFKGCDMTHFVDRKSYVGNLFDQLEQVEAFIKNHLHLSSDFPTLQRKDRYEIPMLAIREALVNAVVHRDYSNHGRSIKINIFDDRLTILSPGGLPTSLTLESVLMGRSEIRNRVLARIFKELGYIEQWGSGIPRIVSLCGSLGLELPEFQEIDDFLQVVFYRPKAVNDHVKRGKVGNTYEPVADVSDENPDDYGRLRTIKDEKGQKEALSADEKAVFDLVDQYAEVNRKQVVDSLGFGKTKAFQCLQRLVEKGLLLRVGEGRATRYKSIR